jgi:inorganic pyrophosphatase
MLLHELPLGSGAPEIINVVIEIPKGSSNKYEYDSSLGTMRLDRVLYSPLFYPFDYGFVPQTKSLDGDPLDAFVMVSHSTFPGCIVEARAIGVLEMVDEKGQDEKVFCVATRDPRYAGRKTLEDLQEHTLREVIHFFEVYKSLEEKAVEIIGWKDAARARELIEAYRTDRVAS